MEHVTNCLNPQYVYNKYLKRKIFVDCQKCEACRQRARSKWIARMNIERQCWQFCYMLYLDYNDTNLPRFDFSENGDYLVEACPRLSKDTEPFGINELIFKDENERKYFVDRINSHPLAFPHPSVRDIQNFKKRLNTYIKREVTGHYKNFRSCIASEIGPSTFRPHYHGILFFNDRKIAEKLPELVRKAWSDDNYGDYGHCEVSPDKGASASYVAKYIYKPADLPEIYSNSAFAPFFLTSRNPPIGSLLQSSTEIRDLFFSSSPVRVVFSKSENSYTPQVVPLERRLKNRLFPKCPLYSQIPDYARTELYKSILDPMVYNFESFAFSIYRRTYDIDFTYKFQGFQDLLLHGSNFEPKRTLFATLIRRMTSEYDCLHSLYTLYTVSRRVLLQSQIFGVSFDTYLKYIYKFYDNFALYQLKCFYRKQIEISQSGFTEDYRVFYPETFFPLVSPVDSNEHKVYINEVQAKHKKDYRTKYKNDYVEFKLVRRDPILYKLIKNYYYGKKCNENVEAFSYPWEKCV